MDPILVYEASCSNLVLHFLKYMWFENWDGYWIWNHAGVYAVNDYFFGVNEMYETIKHQIKPDIVFDRYDEKLSQWHDMSLYWYWRNYKKKLL